jgi:hypothetical protein
MSLCLHCGIKEILGNSPMKEKIDCLAERGSEQEKIYVDGKGSRNNRCDV